MSITADHATERRILARKAAWAEYRGIVDKNESPRVQELAVELGIDVKLAALHATALAEWNRLRDQCGEIMRLDDNQARIDGERRAMKEEHARMIEPMVQRHRARNEELDKLTIAISNQLETVRVGDAVAKKIESQFPELFDVRVEQTDWRDPQTPAIAEVHELLGIS